MRTRLIFFVVAVLSLTISPTSLTSNAAPNPIEIISISEVSSTSVEILFDSSISKKSLSYYVINTVVTSSVGMPKNIKKVIKTKSNGLITTVIKDLNPKASYKFSVSAKTNKGKMISSEAVEYSSLSNLMDVLSNLPADWGNPKPVQLPTPAPTSAPVVLPAFTLTASSETRTVNTAATGFTINSTGSTITSFAINATPPNMSFNTTTGALTGTPNTIAGATAYTITGSNASGSATRTFTLTVTVTAPAFTISSASETKASGSAITGYTIASTGGTIASYAISPTAPAGLTFNTTTGLLSGTPTTVAGATAYTITAINASGSATRTFTLTVTVRIYTVGERGPGGGFVFYVSPTLFTQNGATGSMCTTDCKYLEVAPATWQSGGVSVQNDIGYQWSDNTTVATGQDFTSTTSQGAYDGGRKFNWEIGQGFYNTSVMKVAGAVSGAQAAVLAYTGGGFGGQWFIPSVFELNALCKYARGAESGNLTTRCSGVSGAPFKDGTANDSQGFLGTLYQSSSERSASENTAVHFYAATNITINGQHQASNKANSYKLRPIRAFGP